MVEDTSLPLEIKGLTLDELQEAMRTAGFPAYRAAQIAGWVYENGVGSYEEMTNLPKELRSWLKQNTRLNVLELFGEQKSHDGTAKFLFGLHDGNAVETALIPEGKRNTVCISTQVGCAMGCLFCASGKGGLVRDLTPAEIVDQVLQVRRLTGSKLVTNIVFMGIGEPLANYNATVRALKIFRAKYGLGKSPRRITLSTVGLPDRIRRLVADRVFVKLALSLHAPDDATRARLVPAGKRYPIDEIMSACQDYAAASGYPLTLEYVMLDGVNDTVKTARTLARIAKKLDAKVNLILMNPFPDAAFEPSSRETVLEFQKVLRSKGVLAFIRKSKGADIDAACGQLRSSRAKRAG